MAVGSRGDERVPEGVRPDRLVDPGLSGETTDDAPGGVAVQPLPVGAEEDRSFDPFAGAQVDGSGHPRSERDGDDLAALAVDREGSMAAFDASASMSAPSASETRSPLIASSDTSACSIAEASPAATSSAPTSLRSRPVAWDS